MAGEDIEHGLREVTEELGVEIEYGRLNSLGYRVEVADQPNGQRNREYQAVFLVKDDRPLLEFRPDPKEVYGLLQVPLGDGMALFSGERNEIAASGIAYDSPSASWRSISETIARDRFLPRIQKYYLTMMIMAERLLEGNKILSIS
jgi:hypothetical protein